MALLAQCKTGNTAESVTVSNPSLSAGAVVLQDRGPGEGHQAAAGGRGYKNLKVIFHLHISLGKALKKTIESVIIIIPRRTPPPFVFWEIGG